MKFNFDKKTNEVMKASLYVGVLLILFIYIATKLDFILLNVGKFLVILLPFIFGFSFAFLMMPVSNKIEYEWLAKSKMKAKTKRKVASILSILILLIIVISVIAIIVPQIYTSVLTLSQNSSEYINNIDETFSKASEYQWVQEIMNMIWLYSEELLTALLEGMKNSLPQILNFSVNVVKTTINVFIGLFVAVYIMFDRERFVLQIKKISYAIFPKKSVEKTSEVLRLTGKKFNAFVLGKTLDSFIIGIICFAGMVLMKMEYALLISVIIGVTNMIPIFGPFIGAVPGFLILIIFNPTQAFMFLIWILILQQFDGNILGPYILGDSVGLPSFWVMFSIIVGGGLFGVIGMFLGVPFFAVIYILVKNIVESRLEHKNIEVK